MPRILLTQADANVEIDTQLNTSPRITAAEHRELLKSIVQSLNFLVEASFFALPRYEKSYRDDG